MNKIIDIIGYGGHSKVILDLAKFNEYNFFNFHDENNKIDNSSKESKIFNSIIVQNITNDTIIAIGSNHVRQNLSTELIFSKFITLIHPSAIIGNDVKIDIGTVIMAGVIIQPGTKIGKHCIINTGACIDHDVVIHDFVHIAPCSSIAGGVVIGEGTFLGIGAIVINNINIGSWSIIGAGSVVIKDLISNITAVGNPAHIIRHH